MGEDVPDARCVLAKYVRVDAQGDSRVDVAKPGGYYVDGDPGKQQSRGVKVAQIVQAGVRQRPGRRSD